MEKIVDISTSGVWKGDLIRCKDCKYRNERCGMGERRWCERLNMSTTPDDYCSYGEREGE